jgi:multidrug efflux pump subunit AcrA (membrane-fusion protein)
MKRLIIPLAVVLVILLIGGMGYLGFRSTQANTAASSQAIPQTIAASRGDVEKTVTAPGKLIGTNEATLTMDVAGQLSKLNVRSGDVVKAGQVLAALDTTDLELQVAQAEQTYLKQQAAYSATIQPDPKAVSAAEAAVSSAAAAYRTAQQKFNQRQDQITTDCLAFKNASDALAMAQAAYDSVANDWKAKNYAIYTIRKDAGQCYRLHTQSAEHADINDGNLQTALAQLIMLGRSRRSSARFQHRAAGQPWCRHAWRLARRGGSYPAPRSSR